ncbi:MAG: EcsC family protein [Desulfatibacillaceae bacterium]
MKRSNLPDPVLDQREIELVTELADRYRAFCEPNLLVRRASGLQRVMNARMTPAFRKWAFKATGATGPGKDLFSRVQQVAAGGFEAVTRHAATFTVSRERVLEALAAEGAEPEDYSRVCATRSYIIEQAVAGPRMADRVAAFAEGAATGAPGLLGLPFAVTLSFLLYFRAVQSTALFYGYDVREKPSEMAFASAACMVGVATGTPRPEGTLSGLIERMMYLTDLSEFTKKGGGLAGEIRALAMDVARKAVRDAGQQGVEAGVFKNFVEQMARFLAKRAGMRGLPLIGAAAGALSDSWYMDRALRGSNLIYHKRFLLEKEQRVAELAEKMRN